MVVRVRPIRRIALVVAGLSLILVVALKGAASFGALPSLPPVAPTATPRLLFGMGQEADGVMHASSDRKAFPQLRLLTSWYNGPGDLSWMAGWHNTVVPAAYGEGYALHLIVWSSDANATLQTKYGPACGRAYPLSAGFLGDMTQLAQIYAGSGPLYVSLFAEFQTYPCMNNQWVGAENYYRALKDQYLAALRIFHQYAPNARVSLCWGGWQTRWTDTPNGGGNALFPHFADVMAASDFQSFQAMQSDSNVSDVAAMTKELHRWGPVMLAYYRPDSGAPAVIGADLRAMLTGGYLTEVTADGLFAWSFMDSNTMAASAATYTGVERAVARYAAPWIVPPSLTRAPITMAARAAPTGRAFFDLGPYDNSIGVADDGKPGAANFDGIGDGYSAQALGDAGFSQGQMVAANGVAFQWPRVAPGAADNVAAKGQTMGLSKPADGTALAVLGAADYGPTTGLGTIFYRDGSTQSFTLGFSDWTLNDGTAQPIPGNSIAATMAYRDGSGGPQTVRTVVFYAAVPLRAGKAVVAVTLPNQASLHVFAMTVV